MKSYASTFIAPPFQKNFNLKSWKNIAQLYYANPKKSFIKTTSTRFIVIHKQIKKQSKPQTIVFKESYFATPVK